MRTSPQIASTILPNNCSLASLALGGMGATGRKYSWSSPKESQEGTREDSGIPGLARSPEPALRRALPAPAVPASRKRSLCGYDSRSCPFPARPGARRAVSSAPFKFWGVGLVRSPCGGFRPGCPVPSSRRVRSLGRAPHSCVREAASPWNGALLGGIVQPESHFSSFHLEQGRKIRGTHPRRTALPWASAELGSRSPDACTGAGHSGQAPLFPWIPPTSPAVLTCPGGAHTEAHN